MSEKSIFNCKAFIFIFPADNTSKSSICRRFWLMFFVNITLTHIQTLYIPNKLSVLSTWCSGLDMVANSANLKKNLLVLFFVSNYDQISINSHIVYMSGLCLQITFFYSFSLFSNNLQHSILCKLLL